MMSDSLIPVLPVVPAKDDKVRRLVESFWAGRNQRTLRAYRQDLEGFRVFVGTETIEDAARVLLGQGHGDANGLALSYKAQLVERGLAPATINRRLAALRSLVRLARTLGLVPWSLEIKDVPRQAYRDTKGPAKEGFIRLLDVVEHESGAKALRDRAILHLLFDLALRREEVVTLDVEHLDIEGGTIEIMGKGRSQREKLTLPSPTASALAAWVDVRGAEPGALFINFDRAGKGRRLTGHSVYRLVRDLGNDAGIKARPHGLRHAAITAALDLTRGDLRAVQRFSRHRDVRVLNAYDDNRTDLAGKVASMVAAAVELGAGRKPEQ